MARRTVRLEMINGEYIVQPVAPTAADRRDPTNVLILLVSAFWGVLFGVIELISYGVEWAVLAFLVANFWGAGAVTLRLFPAALRAIRERYETATSTDNSAAGAG